MGFATGFTGGVTLTLSIAYLTVLAHRRNRETQSQILRTQAISIRSLLDPLPPPLPPRRSEVATAQREELMEVAKDRWNAELANAVQWVQRTDWGEVREGMEQRASFLWRQAFGGTAEGGDDKDVRHTRPLAQRTRTSVEQAGSQIASATREAFSQARDTAEQVELSAENAALDARLRSRRALENMSTQVQSVIGSVIEKGEDTAKTAVQLAKAQVEEMTGANTGVKEPGLSPVEKALQQRYGQRGPDKRSVQEVLKERYTPMDQRDNTILRGL